jgi:hypothetical protein
MRMRPISSFHVEVLPSFPGRIYYLLIKHVSCTPPSVSLLLVDVLIIVAHFLLQLMVGLGITVVVNSSYE